MNSISIDCLFAVNFCLDYVALRLCTTILKKDTRKQNLSKHTLAALIIAALECVSCVIPRYLPVFLLAIISFFTVSLLFSDTAFALLYLCVSLWTGILLTFVMNFFKGALPMNEVVTLQTQFSKKRFVLAGAVLVSLIVLKIYFDRLQKRSEKASLEVVYKNQKARFSALRDSGNLLRDPLSGRPVAVLSRAAAEKLGIGADLITDAASKVRVIPVKSVGYTGILYAFVPRSAMIDGKKQNICVALDPKNRDFSGFDAIIPANM